MKKRFTTLVAALIVTTVAVVAQQSDREPSPSKLQQHISYLASDAMDGRRTGTAGANDAARYIAGEFSRAGLTPANGKVARKPSAIIASYLQTFPYVGRVELGKNNVLSMRNGETSNCCNRGSHHRAFDFSSSET